MTGVPCRQAAIAAAVIAAAVAVIAGGVFDRWAIVAGAVGGGVLFVVLACRRERTGR